MKWLCVSDVTKEIQTHLKKPYLRLVSQKIFTVRVSVLLSVWQLQGLGSQVSQRFGLHQTSSM